MQVLPVKSVESHSKHYGLQVLHTSNPTSNRGELQVHVLKAVIVLVKSHLVQTFCEEPVFFNYVYVFKKINLHYRQE